MTKEPDDNRKKPQLSLVDGGATGTGDLLREAIDEALGGRRAKPLDTANVRSRGTIRTFNDHPSVTEPQRHLAAVPDPPEEEPESPA